MNSALWAALLFGAAGWLALPVRSGLPLLHEDPLGGDAAAASTYPGWHLAMASAAGLVAGLLAGGGLVSTVAIALVAGGGAWRVLAKSARSAVTRAREAGVRDLPHLVGLLAAGLRAGAAPPLALEEACRALPGPAADLVADIRPRLAWGADPGEVWADLAEDPVLGALGRSLARAHETGASVVDGIETLATQLAAEGRAAVEDRARAVGVRAALPLGVCLLPAFLLLGVVPSIAALVSQLAIG